jgi:SAM-dependent methyltransferase
MGAKSEQAEAAKEMMALIWPGALAAQAIYAAARLGIADLLADGPRSAEEIAAATKAHAPSVRRLLRALTSLEVFREEDDGRFSQTPLSDTLRLGSHMRPWAIMLGLPFVWEPWGRLYDGVMTGNCAFEEVFDTSFDEYMAAHPDEAEAFNDAMDAGASMATAAVVAAYDFSKFATIVDVGGGRGALLAGILDANPNARGVLFDLPDVLADANKLQVTRHGTRRTVESGDYFERIPNGDALVLKSIIHGCDDERAVRLLRNCREALNPGGRLILVETVLSPKHEESPRKAMMDLMMLTLTGGHERTAEQFKVLLGEAGFELSQIVPTDHGNPVIEAAPR